MLLAAGPGGHREQEVGLDVARDEPHRAIAHQGEGAGLAVGRPVGVAEALHRVFFVEPANGRTATGQPGLRQARVESASGRSVFSNPSVTSSTFEPHS